MYLKRIELFGFKSFADKTNIDFLPGVTCVVGPNGCGKSNISDAIRWVLGERSAKMLRGKTMEDVIFNGTNFRKPLNMAEVSLVIDNRDKVLSIGYEEVVLTRRLYRSGESEYAINKTICRHKDIQDLIMDTGIGSHSYSMIEQGRIDYILQADPDERRFLIEEAAGISRYKSQKEEAIRKLERTENNLLRLTDIVSEVEKNIKYAERQARRVERYREYYETLKQKEIRRALWEKGKLEEELQKLKCTGSELAEDERRGAEQVETLKRNTLELEREEEEKLQEIRFKESKRFEFKSEIERRETSRSFNFEKIGEIKNQIETLEKEIASIGAALADHQAKSLEIEGELGRLRSQDSTFKQELEGMRSDSRQAEALIVDLETKERRYQEMAFEKAGELAACRNEIHSLEIRENGLIVQLKKASETLEIILAGSQKIQSELSISQTRAQETAKAFEEKQAEYNETNTRLKELEESLKGLEENKSALDTDIQELSSQIKIWEALERALYEKEGLSQDAILRLENELSAKAILGMIQVESGYEKAVESALGPVLGALILRTRGDLVRLEAILGREFRELPLLIQKESGTDQPDAYEPGGISESLIPFKDVVRVPEESRPLIGELLKRTYFAKEDLPYEEYLRLQEKLPTLRIVHRSGDVWGPGALVTLKGSQSASESLLEGINQKTALITETRNKKEAFSDLETRMVTVRNEIVLTETRLKARSDEMQTLQLEAEISKHDRTQAEEEDRRLSSETRLKELEAQTFRGDILSLQDLLKTHRDRLSGLEKEEITLKVETARLDEELKGARKRREEFQIRRSEREHDYASLAERIRINDERIVSYRSEASQEEAKKTRYVERIADYNSRLIEIRTQNETIEEELKALRERLQAEELEIHVLTEVRVEIQERRKGMTEKLSREERELEATRLRKHQDEMKIQENDYKLAALGERLFQAYKIDLKTALSSEPAIEEAALPQLDEEIQYLRDKVAEVGTVNLLAVEEYDELKKRFDFLDFQKKDLEQAREELMEAIRKINRTTKKLFEETYGNVRRNFQEYYRILFGGGQADLVMLDEQNPLDSGIDIVARPPGKKTQNISSLSGGEKALTAIALLFSLFQIKPSPFSVLDEIDAPLDEANIDRFLKVLESFLKNTQFILVTHNRKTIARGSTLYGVTMQEAGVSKVVSVKLQNEEIRVEGEAETGEPLSAKLELK